MATTGGAQKQKLLLLKKIFEEKTNENNPLTVEDIIRILGLNGINVERKTVYDDIRTLINSGMDIVISKKSHSNAYYLGERVFQNEELHILADAVASSKFLTKKKSNELISKLATLTDEKSAKTLKRNIYVTGRVKSFNEMLYYNVNKIHEAIVSGKEIKFRYYEYNLKKQKQHKHNGDWYYVSPYHLIWENDNYYLVCYCNKHEKICRYRVDKISDVALTEEKCRELSEDEQDFAKSLISTYNMYGCTQEKITVEFDNDLIGVVIDRYGDDISVHNTNDKTFKVFLDVQISPTFWGWLFQFGDKAKIVSPKRVINQAKKEIEKLNSIYR